MRACEVSAGPTSPRPVQVFDNLDRGRHEFVDVLVAHGVDVRESPSFAGCGEAQASLAAWHAFDRGMARARAEAAAKLNRAWSPLALLLSLAPEN